MQNVELNRWAALTNDKHKHNNLELLCVFKKASRANITGPYRPPVVWGETRKNYPGRA